MRLLIRIPLFCLLVAAASAAALRFGPASLAEHEDPGNFLNAREASAAAADRGASVLSYPLVVAQVPSRNAAAGTATERLLPMDSCAGGQIVIYYPNGSRRR